MAVVSKIEVFASRFSKIHKNWTDDIDVTRQINKVFADSLAIFYETNKDAFDNILLRLEDVADSANGRNLASFECWDHFIDSKRLRAHIYTIVSDSLRKKLSTGNFYYLTGLITDANLDHNVGYNPVDNTCDVGIIHLGLQTIIHSNQASNSVVH